MKQFLMFFGFMLIFVQAFAQDEDLFSAANADYGNGNYEEAIAKYTQILDNGKVSASLYYNLANAHYKLNNIAPSVYYYEKALELKPGDEDIKNNIEFARNMTIDDIEAVEQSGFNHSFNQLVAAFSYGTWTKLAIFLSFTFVILFLSYYFSRQPNIKRLLLGGAFLALFLCIFTIVFAFQQRDIIQSNQFAIIFSQEAEVRNEPNLRGTSAFTLHEGTKAKILEDYQEWAKIELANGAQGWIKLDDLKVL